MSEGKYILPFVVLCLKPLLNTVLAADTSLIRILSFHPSEENGIFLYTTMALSPFLYTYMPEPRTLKYNLGSHCVSHLLRIPPCTEYTISVLSTSYGFYHLATIPSFSAAFQSLSIPPCTEYRISTYYTLVYPFYHCYGFYHLTTVPSFLAAFQFISQSLSIPPCKKLRY